MRHEARSTLSRTRAARSLPASVRALATCVVLAAPGAPPVTDAGPPPARGESCGFEVTVSGTTYASRPGDRAIYMPDVTRNDGIITVTLVSSAYGDQVTFAMGGVPVAPGTYEVSDVGGTLAWAPDPGTSPGYSTFSGDQVLLDLADYTPHTRLVGTVRGTVRDATAGSGSPPLALNARFTILPDPDGAFFLDRYCEVPSGV